MGDSFVIVLDKDLPPGIAANAAAVLALSAGKRHPHWVGEDLPDASGSSHPGITAIPIPVLAAAADDLSSLRAAAAAEGAWVVDFTESARRANKYEHYAADLASTGPDELSYIGIALAGERSVVKGLTGSFPLFR